MDPRRNAPSHAIHARRNDSVSTILANTVVILGNTEDEIALPTATTDDIYGVTMHDIPAGKYGDIQTEGLALCRAAGALATPGTKLMTDAAGRVLAWAAAAGTNAAVVGATNTVAGAQDDVIEVHLAGPFTMHQG